MTHSDYPTPRISLSPQAGNKTRAGFMIFLLLLLTIITACTNPDSKSRPLPRPVKVFRVGERTVDTPISFAGEVRARYETTLAFRVAGKVLVRQVEVGERVRKGQLLARLDPADYRLATQALKAQLAAARAELVFTKADLSRYRELFNQRLISPPELDRHETAVIAARERLAALETQLSQAANQLAYTELHADRDGVVTWLQVESGQVVSAGQPLVKLARIDEKEVLIQIPEHRLDEVHVGQDVVVLLWAKGERRYQGRIREIAEAADPSSRTYDVKVTLLEGLNGAHLGMTATVELPLKTDRQITIPLSAVFAPLNEPSLARVWQVNETNNTVASVPVHLGESVSNERIIVSGLTEGQLIVRAGVHRLKEGQTVRILDQDQANAKSAGAEIIEAQP